MTVPNAEFQDRIRSVQQRLEKVSGPVPDEITEDVKRAISMLNSESPDPDMAAILSRKVAEFIINDIYQRELGKRVGTQPLENKIQQLSQAEKLPPTMVAYANNVKALGNLALHGKRGAIKKEAAVSSLDSLMLLVEWYCSLTPPPSAPEVSPTATPERSQPNEQDIAKTKKQYTPIAKRSGGKKTPCDTAAAAHATQKWRKLTLVAIILLAALVAAGIWYRTRRVIFHEKDTIVLADFDNQTGESGWDPTLKLALANDLEDSQYLNLLPDQTISETLKMMKRKPGERLTKDLAKQVCLRNGNKALLIASIAKIGEQYHLNLRAMNCVTEATLASVDADAGRKEEVIAALKRATEELRKKLGESLASVQKYSGPLLQGTTPSLDAMQEYATGLKVKAAQGSDHAVPFYIQAIKHDPEFAEVYAALGAAYRDLGQDTLAMENSRKAYELRDHVSSERERFHIEADYYDSVTGEMGKANQTYLDWVQLYPDDHRPHQNLGANYSDMGQYEKAVEQEETVLQLQPNNVNAFTSLMGDYLALDQIEKAKSVFEEAHKRKLDHNFLGLYRYYTAFLQGDAETMQKQLEWATARPGAEDVLLSAQSDTEAFYGRFNRARGFTQRAAQSANAPDRAALWKANAAMREAEVGNDVQARAIAADALQMNGGRDVELQIALALARAGQSAQAEKIAAKLDAEFPRSTMVQNYWLPTIRAAIELKKGNANKAIELLEGTAPYELGNWYLGHMYPSFLRGEAYLKLGRGREAAAEFQKVLDHRGVVLNFVIGSLAYLQLARAAAISGDTASSRRRYEDFLGLWKDADTNLPILKAAQTEYESLELAGGIRPSGR
jgi:tetratricopeptide (TPR) repeat protein